MAWEEFNSETVVFVVLAAVFFRLQSALFTLPISSLNKYKDRQDPSLLESPLFKPVSVYVCCICVMENEKGVLYCIRANLQPGLVKGSPKHLQLWTSQLWPRRIFPVVKEGCWTQFHEHGETSQVPQDFPG